MKATSLSNAVKIALALAGCGWSVTAQDDFKDCSSYPDPHFIGWGGMLPPTQSPTTSNRRERHLRLSDAADVEEAKDALPLVSEFPSSLSSYDYHGGCKLVLVKDSTVDIHMNTVAAVGSSYIDQVGLRVGTDVAKLKARAGGIVPLIGSTIPSFLGGYPLTCSSQLCELTLSNRQYVRVNAFGNSLSVLVHGLASDFGGATGMCGSWDTPGPISRDGKGLSNGDDMGFDWKVESVDDPFIGSDTSCKAAIPHEGECAKTGCLCRPELATGECACADDRGECLCKANCVTEAEVEEACEHIKDDVQRANCEYDVKITGDVDFGQAPFYQTPDPPLSDEWCDAGGSNCADLQGECVFDCVESEEFGCDKRLCQENDESPDHLPTHMRMSKLRDRCACRYPL